MRVDSLVVGVDIKEDWAADLQYRFSFVQPYASMAGVAKRAYTRFLSDTDDVIKDATGAARQQMDCCLDKAKWCSKAPQERRGPPYIVSNFYYINAGVSACIVCHTI